MSLGTFQVPDGVDFNTLVQLRSEGEAFLKAQDDTAVFDLSELRDCSSAAVALLMSWYRFAHAHEKKIVYTHAAPDLANIIRVSGLNEILPLSQEHAE